MAVINATIDVAVCGAAGRMGKEVVRAVHEADDMRLIAAIDPQEVGRDAGEVAGVGHIGVWIEANLSAALMHSQPKVLVDFSVPQVVLQNARTALEEGVFPVIGATGLSEDDLLALHSLAISRSLGVFVAPNFAIGAVLMMRFAEMAARYMPDVEIIELHHERKLDAPSGTALLTARKIEASRQAAKITPHSRPAGATEVVGGARGALPAGTGGIPIHSVRLPGFVAHQEVIFGGVGQTLTLRHDSTDRRSFMPGVVLAIQKVKGLKGLVEGLENLLTDG